MAIRIVYFGTMRFAVPPLERLLDDPRFDVTLVVSQPDRPAGRGQKTAKVWPVAALARERGVPLLQPETLKDDAVRERLRGAEADLFVVAAYGKIIAKSVLEMPRIAPLNLHGSVLPAYRGASPIQAALIDGLAETGVSLMRMDEKMDHGPVYATVTVPVRADDGFFALEERLAHAAADLLTDRVPGIMDGSLSPVEQDHDAATYVKLIAKEDGAAAWDEEDAVRIARKVRAYEEWPGCFTFVPHGDGKLRLRILEAAPTDDVGAAGTLTDDGAGYPLVHAKKGAVRLIKVQVEGKRPIDGRDLLRGYPSIAGKTLG